MLSGPELHPGGDGLVPGVAGRRRERMPALPRTAWFGLAPDRVCGVLSPSARRLDLTFDRAAHAREGVGFPRLAGPEARTREGFAPRDGAGVPLGAIAGEEAERMAPFEAVEWPPGALRA